MGRQTDRKSDIQTDTWADRLGSSGDGLGMTFKYSRLGVVCVRGLPYYACPEFSTVYGKANKEMRVNNLVLTKHFFHW